MSKKNPLNFFKHSDEFVLYKAGQQVFVEGQLGDEMFVIKTGQVQLLAGNVILETVGPGGIMGEMAIITENEKRSATAQAVADSELVPINREKFRFLIQQTPDFALEVMKILAHRLRQMDKRHTHIFRNA